MDVGADTAMSALDVTGNDQGGFPLDLGGRESGVDGSTIDAAVDGPRPDAVTVDLGAPDAGVADVGAPDVRASDSALDAGTRDASAIDAGRADAPAVDAPTDARDAAVSADRPAVVDAGTVDSAIADVRAADVGSDVPRDVSVVDVGCAGAGPLLTVTSPTSGEAIETCSSSGAAVYFDFTASVAGTAPVVAVGARWVTPDGAEAPPPAMRSAGPYVFRRQVGGPSAGVPALSVFGLRGTWRVEFTALDSCGRSSTVSQSFSLIFTTRRCPNP